ncbi:putative amidohydrolase [Streptacidiphilus sp. MAP12-16]|uniref:carbon-nitrogen hydrolase family protein n=1 Tax=Streptacidiphilus sp. MAP12-16 TaxID=3156300 RepID=UPI00351290BD
MPDPLPIAAVQAAPRAIDDPVQDFGSEVEELLRTFPDTRIAVYPELHLYSADDTPQSRNQRLRDSAEPLTGARTRLLAELAGDLGIWLVPGSICERGEDGQLFNTALAFSPRGELAASYRKIFPWRPYEPYDPGDRFVVFDLPGTGRAGLSICYDAWFPEVSRHLAWLGAEVILNLVKTTTCDRAQEIVLARANAITNQVFVVSVNCAGPLGSGRSLIVDPEGTVRVEAVDASPTVLTDVLDLGHVQRVRRYGTAGLNRVWDQFRADDPPLELPLYQGRIDPARWKPPVNG